MHNRLPARSARSDGCTALHLDDVSPRLALAKHQQAPHTACTMNKGLLLHYDSTLVTNRHSVTVLRGGKLVGTTDRYI